MTHSSHTKGWGQKTEQGAEIWDTKPVFLGDRVEGKDWLKLLFFPKKFFLYRYIKKAIDQKTKTATLKNPLRILDIGCGTGATVIDMKKLFGRDVEVVGIDVVKIQTELAGQKMKDNGIWATVEWYDGKNIPFPAEHFDAVYTSDVLGHVENVPVWLEEINRVLRPGGALAMFSESKLGKHAYIRNYLMDGGLNVDPHAEFHISLYSKKKLQALIDKAGFAIEKMYGAFWAGFWVHPDEFYPALRQSRKFPFLRTINSLLHHLKKITHPFSTALAELYGLLEMLVVGKWVESQGYVILARKKD